MHLELNACSHKGYLGRRYEMNEMILYVIYFCNLVIHATQKSSQVLVRKCTCIEYQIEFEMLVFVEGGNPGKNAIRNTVKEIV